MSVLVFVSSGQTAGLQVLKEVVRLHLWGLHERVPVPGGDGGLAVEGGVAAQAVCAGMAAVQQQVRVGWWGKWGVMAGVAGRGRAH